MLPLPNAFVKTKSVCCSVWVKLLCLGLAFIPQSYLSFVVECSFKTMRPKEKLPEKIGICRLLINSNCCIVVLSPWPVLRIEVLLATYAEALNKPPPQLQLLRIFRQSPFCERASLRNEHLVKQEVACTAPVYISSERASAHYRSARVFTRHYVLVASAQVFVLGGVF